MQVCGGLVPQQSCSEGEQLWVAGLDGFAGLTSECLFICDQNVGSSAAGRVHPQDGSTVVADVDSVDSLIYILIDKEGVIS